MRENDLETMYNELTEISKSEDFDLTGATRTVAIFRVAVECGATTVGFPSMAFLMSKMLTTALGIGTSTIENYEHKKIVEPSIYKIEKLLSSMGYDLDAIKS